MNDVQVAVHTDEDDAAALFLYRKLIREPVEAPVFMPGPPVEASDAEMQVGLMCLHVSASALAQILTSAART